MGDGRLLYRLKRRWSDGTTEVVFEPLELIEKLAALVPPPRANTVRYHGVLAPAARRRAAIVPTCNPPDELPTRHARCEPVEVTPRPAHRAQSHAVASRTGSRAAESTDAASTSTESRKRTRLRYYSWPELMQRVFAVDVLECPACRGALRILAAIHPPEAAKAILDCLGFPSRPPPLAPAEPEPDPTGTNGSEMDVDPDPWELEG